MNEETKQKKEGEAEEEEEIEISEIVVEDEEENDAAAASTNNESGNSKKKKRKFKPKKFISKLNPMKVKKDDKKLKNDEDENVTKEEIEKVSSPKLESFRKTFVKRFSRSKNYKVSPMTSVEVPKDDEPLNNEKDSKEISKSDPNLCNNDTTLVHNKMNEDSLELSKSMHTVDKSVYTTHETSTSTSSFSKENKKVQLKITISGKKVEKVNTASAIEIATSNKRTIVSENEVEVDKASLLLPQQQKQQQQKYKSRTDIILPSTSTTVRVSTSSSDELFNVMVPRNKSDDNGDNANMPVLHQAKSISQSSVPYSTVVKKGHDTSSVSEREIEKYLVLTSNLNSIISAAKDLDRINSEAAAKQSVEFPKNLPELKIREDTVVDPKSNLEKEKQLLSESKSEMKKSRIPVNKQRRSPSNDSIEKETPTVHTQEAHKPYNVNLSTAASTEDLKEENKAKNETHGETPSPPPSELKPEDIKFELGTPVRPPKILQPSPIGPIADIVITEAELSTNIKDQEESNEDIFHSPKSESSITVAKRDSKTRRKIAYIPELSIYTTEEQELLKSNITANHYSESFDIPSLPPDSSIFPVFDESSMSSMTPVIPEKRECLYKILVIGELGTGKTSFIKRYVHQFFSQNYRATIGVDFALKVLSWDESTIIRLQLWDIAGQERFGNMTRVYYKEAVGAFIVFDCTRPPTFDAVNKWKQDLDSKVQLPDGSPIPCILLANKCDQPKQGLVTMPAKIDEFCKQNNFAGWFETSAKDNTNIEESAKALVSKILLNDKLIHNDMMLDGERLVLDAEDLNKPKKFCSC